MRGNPSPQRHHLDPTRRSVESQEFEASLRGKIVGQEEGVRAVVDLYQVFCAQMCPAGRPVGNVLFLGPTGSGKTRIVEAAAEILFGDPRAVIKLDCAEFQHSHEIAKLIGSPPGYLGHRETHPLITQEELAKHHTDKIKLEVRADQDRYQRPHHEVGAQDDGQRRAGCPADEVHHAGEAMARGQLRDAAIHASSSVDGRGPAIGLMGLPFDSPDSTLPP